jgi:hypothetical protein
MRTDFSSWKITPIDQTNGPYKIDVSADVARVGVKFKLGYDYGPDTYPRSVRR